ncbi:MAG TPA: ComF family protein [Marmoricola sp.]|nr:ComF family protein [Marmoricola sp.]HNJ78502.1 ComF family protein [Marmoricola sp.]
MHGSGRLVAAWLDLFAGSSCLGCGKAGALLCADCGSELSGMARRVGPSPSPPGLRPCWASAPYDGLAGELVLWHKERNALSLTRPLGLLLAEAAYQLLRNHPPDPHTEVLLVPVPSRGEVVRSRGHNPVRAICLVAADQLRRLGLPVRVEPLLRQRFRVLDQSALSAIDRRENLAASMMVNRSAHAALVRRARPVTTVLCDDILTTGATAREGQRALEDNGLQVRGIATIAFTSRRSQ